MTNTKDLDKKRKYVLFKADDGRPDHLKPCAFYASDDGCKNGSKCRFLHGKSEDTSNLTIKKVETAPVPEPVAKSSVTESKRQKLDKSTTPSSSSDEELKRLKDLMQKQQKEYEAKIVALQKEKAAKEQSSNHKVTTAKKTPSTPVAVLQESSDDESSSSNSSSSSSSGSKHSSDHSSEDEKFLFNVVNYALKDGVQPSPASSKFSSEKKTNNPQTVSTVQSAPSLKPAAKPVVEPVVKSRSSVKTEGESKVAVAKQVSKIDDNSPFLDPSESLRGLETSGHIASNPSKKKDIFAAPTRDAPTSTQSSAMKKFDPNTFDFTTIDWEALVEKSQTNKRFATDYKNFKVDSTWIKAKLSGRGNNENYPKVVAIDCEMCETTDPVDNSVESHTLIRVSVVDARDKNKIWLDSLVSPMNPITDLRTRIHGITEEQLSAVKFSLRHAQASLLNIIKEDTIIVGHALHHDLKSLHLSHERIIDTSYLFSIKDESNSIPGLRSICDQILGIKLPDTHDSVQDARFAVYAAAVSTQLGPDPGATAVTRKVSHGNNAEHCLLVHRIPKFCSEEHISRMITTYSSIVPTNVSTITRSQDGPTEFTGKATVTFSSAKHADLAFESIPGPSRPDKSNKPQKRVYLKAGGYIYIRK